jgi:hypothetical protein
VIIVRISRAYIDGNRPLPEGAQSDKGVISWNDYHNFIDQAEDAIEATWGQGFYIDLHGQTSHGPRHEIGYLIPETELALSNATLNSNSAYEQKSTIRDLSERSPLSFASLLRGPQSFGTLLTSYNYCAVPSTTTPSPVGAYYEGNYDLLRHGCGITLENPFGGSVCGVQAELYKNVRDTLAHRTAFRKALLHVLDDYFNYHYGFDLIPSDPN